MISNDIKNILTNLFLELAKHERSIEVNRQVLCESTDFDAHQIFNYLLTNNKNITPKDIIKYLSMKKINATEEEVKLLVLFYDKNLDGKLSFEEFINLVRNENSSINNKLFNNSDNNISFNIDFSLCKLLEKEIQISKSLLKTLKNIKNKYGYNVHDIYHSIKSSNFITSESIKNFLINNDLYCLDSDINFIMKRLDINKDGIIDLCEFHAFLGFPNCDFSCLCSKCKTCGATYCDNCYIESHGCLPYQYKYPYQYNNINAENKNPNIRNEREIKNRNNENILLKEKNQDLFKKKIDFSSIKFNYGNNLRDNTYELNQFNNYINFLLEGENKIEEMKIELCQNKDFNVEDTFRLFEKNGRGFLDEEDLKYGFGVLNVYPSEYNMKLFMKRYDLQKKGFISYADFYDILVPFEKVYRDEVEKRIPKTQCSEIILSREINNSLKKLFKTLIDLENKANIERKSLSINIREIFSLFDNNNQGYFYFPNFITYLNSNQLLNNEKINPDLLYIKFNKKRNGRIDFDEFIDELEPL